MPDVGFDVDEEEYCNSIGIYGSGDFRSQTCLKYLERCDIVVTNPPFSLFRDFIYWLRMCPDKKYILIGNLNAITYKEVFPLLRNNEMWMGATCFTGGAAFFVGSKELYDPVKMSNPKFAYIKDDKLNWRVNGVRWYTNVDHSKRHEAIVLVKSYYENPDAYPKYDNYDAINVDKVKDIPYDYYECIGVPVSFMDKYSPDQFEIIGCSYQYGEPKGYHNDGAGYEVTVEREQVQETVYSPCKIKIMKQANGRYEILPQSGVDLKELAEKYKSYGFEYHSGVMGVPISLFDKYCPEQFDIVAFRKGDDGKDLVFTREREREFNRTFVSLFDADCRLDEQSERYKNKWEEYIRQNNNKAKITEPVNVIHPIATNLVNGLVNDCTVNGKKNLCENAYTNEGIEPIDIIFPLSVPSRAAGQMNGFIDGKETYRRILIKRKQG